MNAPPNALETAFDEANASGALDALLGRRRVVVVAERGQQWLATARTCLRRCREVAFRPVWLHVQSPAEVATALAKYPDACVVLESAWDTIAQDVFHLDRWRNEHPKACLIAAVRRMPQERLAEIAGALREAGAIVVLVSPRQVAPIVPLMKRHWS